MEIVDLKLQKCSSDEQDPDDYDYLEIFDGYPPFQQIGNRLCGSLRSPYIFESFSDRINMCWRSDKSITDKGFKIRVRTKGKFFIVS